MLLAGGEADLALALESWLRAFGAALLRGETTLLDPLCYNLANNLLRGVARRVLPAAADTALRWLAADTILCRKFGIGGDSVLSHLLLVDAGLEHGYLPESWPAVLRDDLNLPRTLDGILAKAIDRARRSDMPLEMALCFKRKVLLTRSRETARAAFDEAAALLREIGSRAELRKLRAAWQSRWH